MKLASKFTGFPLLNCWRKNNKIAKKLKKIKNKAN